MRPTLLPRVLRARRNLTTTIRRTWQEGGGRGHGIPEEGAFESIHHMPRDHAPADWTPHLKRVAVTTAFWVPAMSIWTLVPYYARWAVNGHV